MNARQQLITLYIIALAMVGVVGIAWLVGVADFFQPVWLLALFSLPLIVHFGVTGICGLPSRTKIISTSLRFLVLILIIMALADPQKVLKSRDLATFFLLDHSASVPVSLHDAQLDYVRKTTALKEKDDMAGIIVFGRDASVEIVSKTAIKKRQTNSIVNEDYTDIEGAIRLASAAMPDTTRRKLVLMTDGNQNEGDLLEAVRSAAGEGIMTDILPISYDYKQEVLVEKLHLPDKIKQDEPFTMRVQVRALQSSPAKLQIFRDGAEIYSGEVQLKEGLNTFPVNEILDAAGFTTYTARITAEGDQVFNNNTAGT